MVFVHFKIWGTPAFPDIDPFKAFDVYWEKRKNNFPLSQPLFLAASGKIFSHSLFNATLQSLIAHYSVELELSANKWTGHSFRSGPLPYCSQQGSKRKALRPGEDGSQLPFKLTQRTCLRGQKYKRLWSKQWIG